MSVLLVRPPSAVGEAIVRRLVRQDDEVRVLVPRPERWRELGAHVAIGAADDADLIERAGQHARTIVVFDPSEEELEAVLDAARAARIERIVSCGRSRPSLPEDISYVVLRIRPRGPLRRGPDTELVAAAVDAADDIAGDVRLSLDLSAAEDLAVLKLGD